jgi:3-oxoacyl-[acyl-carrier-protein] synthase II
LSSGQRRAVVTGIGLVNPLGIGRDAVWQRLLARDSAIAPIARFDAAGLAVGLAAEVRDFRPAQHAPARLVAKSDRFAHYALAATDLALADARLAIADLDPFEVGISFGNNSGGWDICERGFDEYYHQGPGLVNPWQATAWFPAAAQGFVSIRHGIRGMSKSFACDRASGGSALFFATRAIRWGHAEVMLAGGAEAPITRLGVAAHVTTGELSERAEPERAFLPFDQERAGLVLGEGAAVLVVEERERARRRGARVYGEIAAVEQRTAAPGDPNGLTSAIEAALRSAGWSAGQVDAVFAEGCATGLGDRTEAVALCRVLGPGGPPVTAPKAAFGHLYGASFGTDLACALIAMEESVLPPTVGTAAAAPDCPVRVVTQPTRARLDRVLVNARSREGTNVCLLAARALGNEI